MLRTASRLAWTLPSSLSRLALSLSLLALVGCAETRHLAPEGGGGPSDTGPPSTDTAVLVDGEVPDAGGPSADAHLEDGQALPDVGGGSEEVLAPPDTAPPLSDGELPPQDDGTALDSGPLPLAPLGARSCVQRFEYDAFGVAQVGVAGEFNGWDPTANLMSDPDGDGVYAVDVDTSTLTPGSYGYKIVVMGDPADNSTWTWQVDGANPQRKIVGTEQNSKVIIPDCQRPLLVLESLEVSAATIHVVVAVRDGADAPGIIVGSAALRHRFDAMGGGSYDAESQRFDVTIDTPSAGKHSLTFEIANAAGPAEPLFLPIWVEDKPFDVRDAVLYFAMTDRFFDGDPSVGAPNACLPPDSKANWQGGDWEGVRQKIAAGYFDALGVNTIWLTAVVDNPEGCLAGNLDREYTSYHGYFPVSQEQPEGHLGDLAALQSLVAEAHSHQIRVLVDLVANHLYESHPLVAQKQSEGWFNDYIDCKTGGFDNAPIECWFETYLPDLDYKNDDAVEEMTRMAVWWARTADLDGFRVDAVKHMHENFLRTLRWKLDRLVSHVPGALFWTVGETFTGGWGGGSGPNEQLIKKYVGPTLLHGQFDFPLYWRILEVWARHEAAPVSLADYLSESEGYYGPQALMSNFLGNHDVPRFVSHANGDIGDVWGNGAKEQGWDNPPSAPSNAEAYTRLKLAWSFLFSITGAPLIYYGDEVGMPGAGDPDNRRPMIFDGWSSEQQAVYDHIGKLAKIRAQHPALRRGDYQTLSTGAETLVFSRSNADEAVIVAMNRGPGAASVTVAAPDGIWTDLLGGGAFEASAGALSVPIPAGTTRILAQ